MWTSVSPCISRGLAALATAGAVACVAIDPFEWTLTPGEAETALGQLVNFRVTIHTKSNINSDVELASGAVPDGFTLTLPPSMASTQQTADGTIYVSPAVEEGTYGIEIQAREKGGVFSTKQIQVTVTNATEGADFAVEIDPLTATLEPDGALTFTYYVRPLNGFSGTVSLTLSGLTDDLTLATGLTPVTLDIPPGQGGTFVLRYTPHPPVTSPVQLVLTATSGTIVHSRTYTVTLVPPPATHPKARISAYNGTLVTGLTVTMQTPFDGQRVFGPPIAASTMVSDSLQVEAGVPFQITAVQGEATGSVTCTTLPTIIPNPADPVGTGNAMVAVFAGGPTGLALTCNGQWVRVAGGARKND